MQKLTYSWGVEDLMFGCDGLHYNVYMYARCNSVLCSSVVTDDDKILTVRRTLWSIHESNNTTYTA